MTVTISTSSVAPLTIIRFLAKLCLERAFLSFFVFGFAMPFYSSVSLCWKVLPAKR